VVGEGLRISKTDMYAAYEEWCVSEDEEPKTAKKFTELMDEKGVVKNFEGKKSNGIRIWMGIELRGSDPDPTPQKQSDPAQKSCKQMGGEDSQGRVDENSQKMSGIAPRVERFSENGHNPTLSVQSDPEIVTTPLSWEEDGMEIEYMPEGE
jgi:hypothetical protein